MSYSLKRLTLLGWTQLALSTPRALVMLPMPISLPRTPATLLTLPTLPTLIY
jgi:hypothetical protein